jgi:hypothetical protein
MRLVVKKPNPRTPFPAREGGEIMLPSPRRRGAGGEVSHNVYIHLSFYTIQMNHPKPGEKLLPCPRGRGTGGEVGKYLINQRS